MKISMEKRFKTASLVAGIITFCVVGLGVYFILGFFSDDTPLGYGCFYEDAILKKQYIDTTSSEHGGSCYNGCLFMDVYSEDISFFRCGHVKEITWRDKTYYFAGEGLREDLHDGDSIHVKWCYIPNLRSCDEKTLNGCHRIREVSIKG